MTLLLVLAGAAAIGAVWLLLRPRAWDEHAAIAEQQHQLALVRERLLAELNQLDADCADGGPDADTAGDERRRLEGELAVMLRKLEALETGSETGSAPQETPRVGSWAFIATLAAAVPLLAVVLYVGMQGPTLARLWAPEPVREAASVAGEAPQMVLDMVARLERRLAEQPGDVAGWARLARSYQVLNRPQDAQRAYARAYTLAPDNIEIVSAYASLLYSENPQNLDGKVYELFQRVHALEPSHPGALWFLGLAAYRKQEFGRAVTLWQQLADQLPADSPVRGQVEHAVREAQARTTQPRG